MEPIFKEVKHKLMQECGASYVWSPMDHIPIDTSWNDAMQICEDVIAKENFDEIRVIIIDDWTSASKGVKREIDIAKENKIPIYGIEVYPDLKKNLILL